MDCQGLLSPQTDAGLSLLVKASEIKEECAVDYDLLKVKNECAENMDATGVTQTSSGKYVVQSSPFGPPYKPLGKQKWVCVKAYYPKLKKLVFVMLREAKLQKLRRGIVRERYILNNNMVVKLMHHSCSYLKAGKEDKCKNCMNDKWHAKCQNGREFFILEKLSEV